MTPDGEIWPGHAYVPGQTPRHAEGFFDSVRNTAHPGLSPVELAQCQAFRLGLRYLEACFNWEAHELLEPVWMALPANSRERRFVQGVIQLANGALKLQMGRPKAALRLAQMARDLIPDCRDGACMGVDLDQIGRRIEALETNANDAL